MANIGDIADDFDNPQESGFDDISFDILDLQDPKSAVMLKNQAMDEFTRLNVFKGVTEFQGVVISNVKNVNESSGFLDVIASAVGATEARVAFKIHIPALHRQLGNPCNSLDLDKYGTTQEAKKIAIKKIVADHPWFVTKVWNGILGIGGDTPTPGDWIAVKFAKGPSGGRMIEGQIVRIIGKKTDQGILCPEDIISLFEEGDANPLGGSSTSPSSNSSVSNLVSSLPAPSPFEYITSDSPVNSSTLQSAVEAELNVWKGKKETDPEVLTILTKYWDNLGVKGWSTSTPWSAAFISYVVSRADPNFPKASAHYSYVESASKGTGGWTAWQANDSYNIKAQVGDILIYSRNPPPSTAAHGDVVYKIENNKAILAGGNLSNTAVEISSNSQPDVDADGYYRNFGRYISVLKKNGKTVSSETTGLFADAGTTDESSADPFADTGANTDSIMFESL